MAKKKNKQARAQLKVGSPATAARTGFAEMRWDQKITWISLHVLLLLVPSAMGNLTFLGIGGGMPLSFDQFDIAKLVVMRATTIIALGAWGIGMFMYGGKLRRTKIDWFILAFLVWVLVSSMFSIHVPTAVFGKYRRFEGLLSFTNYALVFFLMVQVADRGARVRSLVRSLVLSSMFVSFYGLMQYAGSDFIQWGQLPFEATRSFSTYGNPDLLGGFLVLVLPLTFAMAISETVLGWRIVYWTAALMCSAVWITAFTRGAWIGGFVALALLALALWRGRVRPHPADWVFIGLSATAAMAIIVRSLSSTNEVLNFGKRITSIFQFSEGSASSRFEIWQAAIDAVKARPVFGFGADTFRLVFPKFKTESYVQQVGYLSVADNVHNYPLQLMSGIGIPGFLLLYGTLGYGLYCSASSAFVKGKGSARLVQAGLWAAVLGYLVHLMFGLSVTGTTVIMWAALGLLLSPLATSVDVPPPSSRSGLYRSIGAIVLVAVGLTLSVMNIRYMVADHYYLLGRIGPYDAETRVAYLKKAVEINPTNDMYRAEVGLQYQQQAQLIIVEGQQKLQSGEDVSGLADSANKYLRLAEEAFLSTIEFVPPEYDNYVFLTSLYNRMGEFGNDSYFDKAIETGLRGVEVEYFGPAVRYQLATAYAAKGENAKAIEHLELAARMDPNYLELKVLLADVLRREGQGGRARELLDDVLSRDPGNAFASTVLADLAKEASNTP